MTLLRIAVVSTLCALVVTPVCLAQTKDKSTDFTFDLFRTVISENGEKNVSLSPYGAELALGMLALGANGETESEIASVLKKQGTWEEYAASLQLKGLEDKDAPLKIATAIWTQEQMKLRKEFVESVMKNYGAEAGELDFAGKNQAAINAINKWCDAKTNGKIDKLFEKLDPLTRCVVASSVYFAADWRNQFDKNATKDGDFTLLDGKKKKTPLMFQSSGFRSLDNENVMMVELPYKNRDYCMVLLMPKNSADFTKFEQELSEAKLSDWCKSLRGGQVALKMPKFTTENDLGLNSVLKKLGMPSAFGEKADFSGINGAYDLYLSEFKQKVFVKVDETGTEAAAVTAGVVMMKAMPMQPKEFNFDRPFIYMICKKENNNELGKILFLGRFVQPE